MVVNSLQSQQKCLTVARCCWNYMRCNTVPYKGSRNENAIPWLQYVVASPAVRQAAMHIFNADSVLQMAVNISMFC